MLNFIVQCFREKPCKAKAEVSNTTIAPAEKVVVEIDYDELAQAIINANIKSEKLLKIKNEEKEQRLQKQRQDEWDKALWVKRYDGKNLTLRLLYFLRNLIVLPFAIVFFREKNISGTTGTYILLKLCAEGLLSLYQVALFILTGAEVMIFVVPQFFSNIVSLIGRWNLVLFVFGNIILFGMIRIAKMELKNTTDKPTVVAIFNAIVAFTAMVFAVIAVFR